MLQILFSFFVLFQDVDVLLAKAEKDLTTGRSVSEVLTDKAYQSIHSNSSFRNLVKRHAKAERISISAASEPGTRMTVSGKLEARGNVGGLLVYVYQTDNRGWYSQDAPHILMQEGDRGHARLFGYLLTSTDGSFEFETIHPQGYPNSNLPQHVHLEVFERGSGRNLIVTELLFRDDARLKGNVLEQATRDRFFISKNEGTRDREAYRYVIKLHE